MHRQARGGENFSKERSSGSGGISGNSLQRFKRLDIYARPNQEFQRATFHGAVVSFFLALAVCLLIWRELRFSMETETVSSLFVNSTIASRVNVTFDVVFPRIPCAFISLDAEDMSGIPQSDVFDNVTRTRLDFEGRPLDGGEKHVMGNSLKEAIAKETESNDSTSNNEKNSDKEEGKDPKNNESECNCYGAGASGECCKTCQDVRVAYRRKGWKFNPSGISTCAGEKGGSEAVGALSEEEHVQEGCRLAGSLEVTRTEGNFHFAPGHQQHRHFNAMSFMDYVQMSLERFNTTHTIQSLSFGDQLPRDYASSVEHVSTSSVLDGHHKVVQDTRAMHQYFLQLVPTTYRLLDGTTVYGSQYSATEHLRHVHSGLSKGLPGVYFYYDVSPVQALVEQKRRGFLSFLTSACGVVGGVYTILGLVNTGIDALSTGGGVHKRTA